MHNFQANIASQVLLDLSGAAPPHARLARALRSGRLAAGSTLPPSRALVSELGCSRWVVTQAYAQLAAEGYVTATVGSGTKVCTLGQSAPAALLTVVIPGYIATLARQ